MDSTSRELFKEIQELDAKGRGFDSSLDMSRMICRVDCDSELMLHRFSVWSNNSGNKKQLSDIIKGKEPR